MSREPRAVPERCSLDAVAQRFVTATTSLLADEWQPAGQPWPRV